MVLRWDSRDMPENAYKGLLLELAGTTYGRHTSGNSNFQVIELDYRTAVAKQPTTTVMPPRMCASA